MSALLILSLDLGHGQSLPGLIFMHLCYYIYMAHLYTFPINLSSAYEDVFPGEPKPKRDPFLIMF